jgi:hypothetical protein
MLFFKLYPVAQIHFVPLKINFFDVSHVIHTVLLEQVIQPKIKSLQRIQS